MAVGMGGRQAGLPHRGRGSPAEGSLAVHAGDPSSRRGWQLQKPQLLVHKQTGTEALQAGSVNSDGTLGADRAAAAPFN